MKGRTDRQIQVFQVPVGDRQTRRGPIAERHVQRVHARERDGRRAGQSPGIRR